MDIMSILGFILAVVLVLFGMTFDQEAMKLVFHNLRAFIDLPEYGHYHRRHHRCYDAVLPLRGV